MLRNVNLNTERQAKVETEQRESSERIEGRDVGRKRFERQQKTKKRSTRRGLLLAQQVQFIPQRTELLLHEPDVLSYVEERKSKH
mmetsp:Transcript_43686/g.138123  ORF Transcript_43686/g.138123 Transcript_43686/m.138123 type:complete len:85 (+) Transcript_43686:97-351(+)